MLGKKNELYGIRGIALKLIQNDLKNIITNYKNKQHKRVFKN